MRRLQRLVSASVLIALSGALVGCSSVTNWDPSDLLDFLDTKKPLPGDRKPVFPDGVPGLQPGVPKELYKGNVEQQQQQEAAASAAAAVPAPAPEDTKAAKRAKKKKPTAASAAPAQDPALAPDGTVADAPAPKPKKKRRPAAPPPADDPNAAPAQQYQSSQPSAFPAPIPSGTFQH
jgi:hypothetical protein